MTTHKQDRVRIADIRTLFADGQAYAYKQIEARLVRATACKELNIFAELDEKQIRESAVYADAYHVNAEEIPDIGAVPIAIADNIATRWGKTRVNSKMLGEFESPITATTLETIIGDIGIPFGKTNVGEMGFAPPNPDARFGVTRHPNNTDHVVEGSSPGAAAAVATGIVPLALAVDTLGGARLSGASAGVVTFRPTYGAISRHGIVAAGSTMDVMTIMANTVHDAATLYNTIAGHDVRDGTSVRVPLDEVDVDAHENLVGLRVGISPELMALPIQDATRAAIQAVCTKLTQEGAEIVEASLPMANDLATIAHVLFAAEASTNLERYDGVRFGYRCENPTDINDLYKRSRAEGFGEHILATIIAGTQILSAACYASHYVRAQKARRVAARQYHTAFQQCDVIIGPISGDAPSRVDAPPMNATQWIESHRFTAGEALASLPACTLQAGADTHGFPIGLQVTAGTHQDAKLLRIASAIEALLPSSDQEPTT